MRALEQHQGVRPGMAGWRRDRARRQEHPRKPSFNVVVVEINPISCATVERCLDLHALRDGGGDRELADADEGAAEEVGARDCCCKVRP